MNRVKEIEFEDSLVSWPIEDLEKKIASLSDRIAITDELSAKVGANPIEAMRKIKERQLQKALSAYGEVNLSELAMDRIPLVFARLQADESAIRRDLKTFDQISGGEKDLKKQLEIAKRVLAEKLQQGGRA